jgi:hypothetical protein
MYRLFFWQNWSKTEKLICFCILTILLFSIVLLGLYSYRGLDNVIHWDILSELDEIPTLTNSFSDGQLKYAVNGNAYLVKERFWASMMQINTTATYIFLGLLIIGLNLLLTAFSALPRYWFLGGMLALAGVFVTFRLETVFNLTNQTGFLVAFAGFAGLAFYFNNFATKVGFVKRLAAFLLLTVVAYGIIWYFSKISHPFLAVASYGLLSAIAITILFVLLISHEIVAALVRIVSNSTIKGKSSLGQFIIISSIYLLNILLIFLEQNKYIDWNVLAISPIVLYLISMILGIWGFRNFSEESDNFNFRTVGVWLYLGLAIIATATISLVFATGNDPLTDAIQSLIIVAHLIMGFAFFLYVILNFIQAIQKGLPVYRILYRPQFLELSLFRLGALVVIVTVFSLKNFYIYYEANAGYYNTIADFYKSSGDLATAEAYYKEAIHNDVRNHKSNYALATLAMELNDKENTGLFLKNALEKNPSPYAYTGLSKVLQEKEMFFDALFAMQDGVRKFPDNQQLLTNLAWLYEKTKVTDSTLHYLKLAKEKCTDCDLADANLLAYTLKYSKVDSLTVSEEASTNASVSLLANQSATVNGRNRISMAGISLGTDSALNVSQFALIYNLTTGADVKSPFSAKDLQRIQQKAANQSFYEDLEFAIASQYYYRENKLEGLKHLTILANDSTKKKQLYNQVVGMWYLQQGVFDKAILHLAKAGDKASVDILQKQDYLSTIVEYQQAQAEELLKNAKTKNDFDKALAISPLNPVIISKTVEFYNSKLRKPDEAYTLLFNALEVNNTNIALWRLYVLQSLKIGVENYAEDGLEKLRELTSAADYQAFLSIYQAQKALMEKNKVGFE